MKAAYSAIKYLHGINNGMKIAKIMAFIKISRHEIKISAPHCPRANNSVAKNLQ